MVKLFAFVVLVSLLLFGCALEHYRSDENSQPSQGNYGADIADCRQLVSQNLAAAGSHSEVAPSAPRDAADGAGFDRADVAHRQTLIVDCMAGRGYNVAAQ